MTRPQLITEVAGGDFSFGAYNQKFLEGRQGISMIALQSRDWKADRRTFHAAGLEVMKPFNFSRTATLPDGTKVEVGFDLTYITRDQAPQAMFFTCCHRHKPEHFYKPDFQSHTNSAAAIRFVRIETDDVTRTKAFISAIGLEEGLFLVNGGDGASSEQIAGFAITVENLDFVSAHLKRQDIKFKEGLNSLVISPDITLGVEITFCGEKN